MLKLKLEIRLKLFPPQHTEYCVIINAVLLIIKSKIQCVINCYACAIDNIFLNHDFTVTQAFNSDSSMSLVVIHLSPLLYSIILRSKRLIEEEYHEN